MPKTFLFKPKWFMGKNIEKKARDLCIGRTLNFPCGMSQFGDIRADLDHTTKPDIIADLQQIPFKPRSFDTVFCDPPYQFYTSKKISWTWIYQISQIPRQRLILKTPKINIKVNRNIWKKTYYIIEDNRQGFTFLQVFDKVCSLYELPQISPDLYKIKNRGREWN